MKMQITRDSNPTSAAASFKTKRCVYHSSTIAAESAAWPMMPVYTGFVRLGTVPNILGAAFLPSVAYIVQTAEALFKHLSDPTLDALFLVANVTLPDWWPAEGVDVARNVTISGMPEIPTAIDFRRRSNAINVLPGSSLVLNYLQLENLPVQLAADAGSDGQGSTDQLGDLASAIWAVRLARYVGCHLCLRPVAQ